MASYLRALNPTPRFPEYTGPHKVGTIDVELAVSQLDAPSPAPEGAVDTVQFRIFYPCAEEGKTGGPINWLPNPQRAHVAAYTRFLGAGSTLAEIIAFFPRLLYYISIPVRKNAPLLKPTTGNGQWPVMIFSHGLGGSRNAYSHLIGSIASHGIVVIAPEHRDRSTPISFIRDVPATNESEKSNTKTSKRTVTYNRISHTPSPEVEAGRTAQLKIRTYELGCIHDALLKMDSAANLTNLNASSAPLSCFSQKLAIHEPGSIAFAGHSFGAATMAQFIKTVYYSPASNNPPADYEPIFSPSSRSAIVKQITPNTPLVLLDMWCLPLRAKTTRWLWDKPLPCYASGGPGGCGVLAVESQAFVKWRVHLKATKRFLSPDPSQESTKQLLEADGRDPVHFYYPTASAHLSQSDFGILFPWVTKKVFASEEPERVMKLNVRAILQLLRERSIPIAPTSAEDMEIGSEIAKGEDLKDDRGIFTYGDDIRGWNYLTTDAADLSDVDFEEDSGVKADAKPSQAVVGGELDKVTEGATESLEELTGTPGTVTA